MQWATSLSRYRCDKTSCELNSRPESRLNAPACCTPQPEKSTSDDNLALCFGFHEVSEGRRLANLVHPVDRRCDVARYEELREHPQIRRARLLATPRGGDLYLLDVPPDVTTGWVEVVVGALVVGVVVGALVGGVVGGVVVGAGGAPGPDALLAGAGGATVVVVDGGDVVVETGSETPG